MHDPVQCTVVHLPALCAPWSFALNSAALCCCARYRGSFCSTAPYCKLSCTIQTYLLHGATMCAGTLCTARQPLASLCATSELSGPANSRPVLYIMGSSRHSVRLCFSLCCCGGLGTLPRVFEVRWHRPDAAALATYLQMNDHIHAIRGTSPDSPVITQR